MVTTFAAILVAYLIGAVPFGLLVARAYGVRDIRKVGSGNIGATNVLRTLGMKAAVWVYLLDIGKGAAVVAAARLVQQPIGPETFYVLVGLAAILGHVFPVYLGFKGGKGVATTFGVLLVLLPVETLMAAAVFLTALLVSRFVSVASIAAALTFPLAVTLEYSALNMPVSRTYWILTVLIGVMVPVTHIKNIQRLLAGTENRASFGRRRGGDGE